MKKKIVLILLGIILIIVVYSFIGYKADSQQETLSWRGITPGQTTKEQVIALLGEPDEIGESHGETYFEYKVPDSKYQVHRIYFGYKVFRGAIVSWLDIVRGVDGNDPYIIHQAMLEYRNVDTAAQRRFGDVGSDEIIYVWAKHGIALVAVPPNWLGMELPADSKFQCELIGQVPQKYFINDAGGYLNYSSACDVVVRTVIFPPMEFEKFWAKYGYRISRVYRPPEEYFYPNP